MKHLRTLLIGLVTMVSVGWMEARTVKYTISLVQPEYVSEKGEAGWVDNTVVTLPGNKEFFIDQWDPVTGEIRVDCGYGCWASNFSISNKTPFRGAITKVELVYTGELDPEFVTFETKTGNFPVFYGDYEAKVEPGKLVWDLDWHGKKDKFHIQIESTRDLKMSRVFVSEINVYYNNRVRCNTDGPAVEEEEAEEDDEVEPEEPEQPADTLVGGDPDPGEPIKDPQIDKKKKGNLWNWIVRQDPRQPQDPQKPDLSDEQKEDKAQKGEEQRKSDPTQPEPPGTIDVKIKKHLLEPLTEEEFLQIRAKNLPFGEECEKAARNWVKHIPDIKSSQPEACLAELRTMNYNDYLQFVHGLLETMVVSFVDVASMFEKDHNTKEEQFLRQTKDQLIVLAPEWVRLYDIKDPDINGKMKEYCKKYIKLSVTAEKYPSLYQYLVY